MALGSRYRNVRALRLGRGRPVAPTGLRRTLTVRPGGMIAPRGRFIVRGRRGGFFSGIVKGIGKVVKTVTKVPVVGAIAKAAVGSLPVLGQVVTAVNAFKGKTAVGVAASPTGGATVATGQAPANIPPAFRHNAAARRRPKAKKAKKAKRAKRAKRSGGGTAKQRAARARFARAAKKGRIRKGQRL